jgi:hypothetical protein
MKPYESRWGRFYLQGPMFQTVRGDPRGLAFEQLLALMGRILVVEAHHSPCSDEIEYLGISPLFDRLEEGEAVPEYSLEGIRIVEPPNEDGVGSVRYEVKAFRRLSRCSRCGSSRPRPRSLE